MRTAPMDTLRRYFAGMAESTFVTQLGIADPPLVDYISDLLARFIHRDSLYCIRNARGQRLTDVVEMLWEAAERTGGARRQVHRHIGDFTLFWTGVYPEAIARQQTAIDALIDYREQGKRAYWIASTLEPQPDDYAPGAVLERLSSQFELCTFGLREIRAEWERREGDASRPFLIN